MIYTFECTRCGHERDEVMSVAEYEAATQGDGVHCDRDGCAAPMVRLYRAPRVQEDSFPHGIPQDWAAEPGGYGPIAYSRSDHKRIIREHNEALDRAGETSRVTWE